MMQFLPIAAIALFQFSSSVYAAPASNGSDIPEVIPGDGFPSLESLGVTSAQLYAEKPAPLSATQHLALAQVENFKPFCGGGRNDAARVDDVIACFNYLTKLGHKQCVAPKDGVEFCRARTASIRGVTDHAKRASSYCSDVALAVQWVFTNCNHGGLVEGDQAANGNGHLVVVAGGHCGSPVASC